MRFDLRRPCATCPFRTDCAPGWLGGERAAEIAGSVATADKTFPCHKTTRHDALGRYRPTGQEQHCAGALLVLDRDPRAGGLWANFALRLAGMLTWLRPERLDRTAPVFDSLAAFIQHHADRHRPAPTHLPEDAMPPLLHRLSYQEGRFDFDSRHAPHQPQPGRPRTGHFTLSIFQWQKRYKRFGVKKGPVVDRVRGEWANPLPAYQEANRRLIRLSNAEIAAQQGE